MGTDMITAPLIAPVAVSTAPITAAVPISPARPVIDVHKIIAATDDSIPATDDIVVIATADNRAIVAARPIATAYDRTIARSRRGSIANARSIAARLQIARKGRWPFTTGDIAQIRSISVSTNNAANAWPIDGRERGWCGWFGDAGPRRNIACAGDGGAGA
jgi:hypothetical protein